MLFGPRADDNRHALVVDATVTQATGTAEVEAALAMLERLPGNRRVTVGAIAATTRRRLAAVHGRGGSLRT